WYYLQLSLEESHCCHLQPWPQSRGRRGEERESSGQTERDELTKGWLSSVPPAWGHSWPPEQDKILIFGRESAMTQRNGS
ncbi:hypothetical protein LEMLEM_LOCUS15354, partial [Lemmus lemmus]